jgi:hypothetical protein
MTERRPPGRASRTTVTPEAVTIKRTKTVTTSRILALHQDRKKHLFWPNSVIRHGHPRKRREGPGTHSVGFVREVRSGAIRQCIMLPIPA